MADTKRRINHGSEAAIRLRSPVISLYRAGTSELERRASEGRQTTAKTCISPRTAGPVRAVTLGHRTSHAPREATNKR